MTRDPARRARTAWVVFVTCGLFGASGAARAQGDESALFQEIPSVYGASKYEQRVDEAPSAVSIVTAEEIRKYGYRNLSDILRAVRGFYTSYDRSYTYVGLRGFDRLGDFNSRILLLIDGYRTNDNIYDQAYTGQESPIDVDLIDRVEVIRGPSSSLYGSNAFFAVINVITKRGRDLRGGEVSGEVASFDTWKGRLSYGERTESGHEFLVSATYFDSAGQRLYFPEYSSINNGVAEHCDAERSRKFFLKETYGDLTFTAVSDSREKHLPTGIFLSVFNDPRTLIKDPQLNSANLTYQHQYSRDTELLVRLGYNSYDYEGQFAYPTYVDHELSSGRWATLETMFRTRIAARHTVVTGLDEQYNGRQQQTSADTMTGVRFDDRRTSNRWGLYAQDEYQISDRFLFNLGVRHDQYDQFGGATNPRAGLVYRTQESTAFKLLYGRAFRAPNVYELYYNDAGFSQKANPLLQPETISTYEAIVEHPLRRDLRLSASVFHYSARDLINLELDTADNLYVFQNVDRVQATGLELELEGHLAWKLDGRLSYAYQKSEVSNLGQPLTNSPQHLAKVSVSMPLMGDRLALGFETQYTSQRLTSAGAQTDSYILSNLVMTSRLSHHADLSLGIYNLFDTKYADPVSDAYWPVDAVTQDGRTGRVKLRYEF